MLQFLKEVAEMNGYEAFKKYREESGLSVRNFAAEMGIAPRSVSYYESGHLSCTQMPVYKAIKIFDFFGVSIEEFYDEYYPYKQELDKKIQEWKRNNPRELNYEIVKNRLYHRLAKIKQRQSIPTDKLEVIYDMYNSMFNQKIIQTDEAGNMTDLAYEKYVLPIFYEIRKGTSIQPEDRTSQVILDAFLRKAYLDKDLCSFCDVSKRLLSNLMNGGYDFNKVHIIAVLKLCYVLDLKFEEVFRT